MRKSRLIAAGVAVLAAGGLAWGAGMWSTLPIVGQPSFCGSTVSGVGSPANAPWLVVPGSTQGTTSSICGQTIPAGPPNLSGNELIPADTSLTNGIPPATVTIPSGLLSAGQQDLNVLVGSDFGQALWQRGTTPNNDISPTAAVYGPDGWYVYSTSSSVTTTKQTAVADAPPNSLASARIQRPLATVQTGQICTGQLVPDSDSQTFAGKTAIFSVDMLAGGNFSPAGSAVSLIIAYHSAADVTVGGANGQGTNTATFASSAGTTQNITGYTEAVNSAVNITTAWARYSVAAAIPSTIPGTTTPVAGIGVKLCWTPTGVAGANDWPEFGKAQLEARLGSSVGFSTYARYSNDQEWQRELQRYFQITESSNQTTTPIYAMGMAGAGQQWSFASFPAFMRITPVTSPFTVGSFEINIAGVPTSPVTQTAGQNTQVNGQLQTKNTVTAGQAIQWINGPLGTGRIGFSAEP